MWLPFDARKSQGGRIAAVPLLYTPFIKLLIQTELPAVVTSEVDAPVHLDRSIVCCSYCLLRQSAELSSVSAGFSCHSSGRSVRNICPRTRWGIQNDAHTHHSWCQRTRHEHQQLHPARNATTSTRCRADEQNSTISSESSTSAADIHRSLQHVKVQTHHNDIMCQFFTVLQ